MTLIERMARAICVARGDQPERRIPEWYCGLSSYFAWEDYRKDARAALLAAREPTEAMVDAAFNAEPVPVMRAGREHYRAALVAAACAALSET